MTDPLQGDTVSTTPPVPYSNIHPTVRVKVEPHPLTFEPRPMKEALIELRRRLTMDLREVERLIEACV